MPNELFNKTSLPSASSHILYSNGPKGKRGERFQEARQVSAIQNETHLRKPFPCKTWDVFTLIHSLAHTRQMYHQFEIV